MLKDYKESKPTIETDRVVLKPMVVEHATDLKEWLGLDEIYTYWGRKATSGEKNPEAMFKKRNTTLDFRWSVILKENNKVIGELQVLDIVNCRMGDISFQSSILEPRNCNRKFIGSYQFHFYKNRNEEIKCKCRC